MPTYSARAADIDHKWYVVDASGQVLGRLASEVAKIIRGKHKPTFTPHVDTGDHVIVVNAARVVLTGKKRREPVYRHSGYPGGLKSVPRGTLLEKRPERLVERAIKGMIPHNHLGAHIYHKLRVYAGEAHPHAAQQPQPYEF